MIKAKRGGRAGRGIGDRIMSGQTFTRRAAIVACGAFALVTAMPVGTALAQSSLAVGAIRVDVAPLRAAAGDPTASWVEQELPRQLAQALSGRPDAEGANAHRAGRFSHTRAEQGQPGLGQHQRRRDARWRRAASAGDVEILGFGDRCGDDRAIQSRSCFGGSAGAGVLDCARPLIRPVGGLANWAAASPNFADPLGIEPRERWRAPFDANRGLAPFRRLRWL